MRNFARFSLLAAVAGAFALSVLCVAPGAVPAAEALSRVEAVSCPTVTLQAWKTSTREEKLAFLFGFATMLELEKEWQNKNPLPITRSINASWVRGLDGVTIGDMVKAVDAYAAKNPHALDISVLEVLGRMYVVPKMTADERSAAARRVQEIRANRDY